MPHQSRHRPTPCTLPAPRRPRTTRPRGPAWSAVAALTRTAAVVAATVALLGTAASAATAAEPTLQRADITVTVQPDGTARLRADYTLSAPATDPIPHRVLPRSGSQLTRLTLAGSEPVSASDPTTYPVRVTGSGYTLVATSRSVDPDGGDVPVPVPDIATAADADVQISVILPQGQQLTGDSLPAFTSQTRGDGRTVLTHTGTAVPSAVVAPYGVGAPFTLGDVLTAIGLIALAITCLLWFRQGHRQQHVPTTLPANSAEPEVAAPPVAASNTRSQP